MLGSILWGLVLRLMLFNVFVNDLDEWLKHMIISFADDTKMGGTPNILKDNTEIQKYIDKLEQGAET